MNLSQRIVVLPEVQGIHGTPVDETSIASLVADRLESVRSGLVNLNTERSAMLYRSNRVLFDRIVDCLCSTEPWCVKLEAARIPGNSHHGAKTVRAFEVTDWNTLHIVAQPNGQDSRRRGFLCLPKGIVKEREGILGWLLMLLGADLTYKRLGPCVSRAQNEVVDRFFGGDEEMQRRAARSLGQFSASLLKSLKRRQPKMLMLELFTNAAEGLEVETPVLTGDDTRQVALNWAVKSGLRAEHMSKEKFANFILLVAVMQFEILEERPDGNFGLGEYGYILREQLREELLKKQQHDRAERRKKLEREIGGLEVSIGSMEAELTRARRELAQKRQQLAEDE